MYTGYIMNKYIKLETAKQLQEWGCNVESDYRHCYEWDINGYRTGEKCVETIEEIEYETAEKHVIEVAHSYFDIITTYAKEFFFEDSRHKCDECGGTEVMEYGEYDLHGYSYCANCYRNGDKYQETETTCDSLYTATRKILSMLQQNNQDEADAYILENCVWNPKNK